MTPTELSKLIPDEVVGAAARTLAGSAQLNLMAWEAHARAAIAAALAAWPGVEMPHVENAPAFIILPLPQPAEQEKRDE